MKVELVELGQNLGSAWHSDEKMVFVIEKNEISLCKPLSDWMMWIFTHIKPQEVMEMASNDIQELCSLLSETKNKNKNKRTKNKRRIKR